MTDISRTQFNKEESDDNMSDYKSSPRTSRRPVTMSTRRSSRMLYLEKYGLNQPGWHSSNNLNDHDNKSSEEEDPQENIENQRKKIEEYKAKAKTRPDPLAPNEQPIGNPPLQRPVSIRNYVQNTSAQKRPSRFVKPVNSASSIGKVALPPTQFIHVHKLVEAYEKKIYIEGYLQKKNDLKSNGASCKTKRWSVWYMELCGPILSLWDASSSSNQDVFPQYINITDSTVNIEASSILNTFSLNSAGANRYILQALDPEMLRRWITALRLSCFECSRIQEIYTRAFLSRPDFTACLNAPKKPRTTTTGFLHVRFPNATGWNKYWVSVSNEKRKRSLFGKKMVPTHGRILFYESKKAKYPVMTLQKVVQAYTIYPESPKLINMATLFKIEGSLYKNESSGSLQLVQSSSGILLMSPTANELAEWLVSIFDTFELYGRPNTLLSDPLNPKALDFGQVAASNARLFLEPAEAQCVDVKDSLLSNKSDFTAIFAQKLKNAPLHVADRSRSPRPASNVRYSRALTCASDISDEEDEKEESESESDEESVKLTVKPNNEITMSESNTASKSSSDISEISSSKSIVGATNMLLHPVNKLDDSFANSILNSPQFNNPVKPPSRQKSLQKKTTKKSVDSKLYDSESSSSHKNENIQKRKASVEKGQTKQNNPPRSPVYSHRASVASPIWSMNNSNASIINPEYNSNWETSSVDPRMMASPTSPSLSSTDPFQQRRPMPMRYSSSATGYSNQSENMYAHNENDNEVPVVDRYSTSSKARAKNRKSEQFHMKPGYFNLEDRKSSMDDQNAMWNRMMMEQRQQQMMMQQYMQSYNTMPMMMPMMDPRLVPQPYMMMDPRFMPPSSMMVPPNMMPPVASTHSNASNRSFRNSQYLPKDVDPYRRYDKKMSSAASVAGSSYTPEPRPRRTKN